MVYECERVYECEWCEAVLMPGLVACPACGEAFDEPVPADATPEEALPGRGPAFPRRRGSRRAFLAAVLLLPGLGWLGFHLCAAPAASIPSAAPPPLISRAAHPLYPTHMQALVRDLRHTGVEAEWPAFGNDDFLLITPTARAAEPSLWDLDTYRRLAQGVYGHFAQTRFESGFSDRDTTDCCVIVARPSGKIVAIDFMGDLQ